MKIPFGRDKSAPKAFDKALNDYLAAAKNSPEDIRIHIKIAELYLKNNNKDKAVSEYLYAATTYRKKKLFQIAISIYNHILSIDPAQTAIYVTLADIYHKNGFNGDAVATLEKLANYYQQMGLNDKTAEVLNKIIEIDPLNEQFKQKVDKFYAGTESLPENKQETGTTPQPVEDSPAQEPASDFFDLEAALEGDSSIQLSAAAENDGDTVADDDAAARQPYNDIFSHIREDAEAAPDEAAPDLYYDLGMAQLRLGAVEEAMKEFEKAIEHNQRIVPSYLQLLQCCRTVNNPEKAEAYTSQALALDSLTEEEKKSLRAALKDIPKAKGRLLRFLKNLRARDPDKERS